MSGPFGSSQWMYKSGDYEVANSLRFEEGDEAFLSRTQDAGNRRTWSFSVWFKRGKTGGANNTANKDVFAGAIDNDNMVRIADDALQFYTYDGSADYGFISSARVRDTTAWSHALFVFNTTSSTAAHRQRIYLNGVELTDIATDYGVPDQDFEGLFNSAGAHTIGKGIGSGYEHFAGYLAEINFIDGVAKTPSDFGEFGDYGEWKPIKYAGSYGNEGYYLDFKSSGVGTAGTTTIGADRSGNGNHWTSTNVAATDQMPDTPSNNFCTINSLDVETADKLKEGSLQLEPGLNRSRATFAVTTGKWYFEVLLKDQSNSNVQIGIAGVVHNIAGDTANEYVRINHPSANGNGIILKLGGTDTDNLGAVANGNIIGVAFDMGEQEISFLVNNSAIASDSTDVDFSGLSNNGTMTPHFVNQNGRRSVVNFGQDSSFAGNKTAGNNADGGGQGDFFYAPPSGYLALCTKNLTACAVTPSEHFSVLLNAGDSSADEAFTTGFQTDWVWSFIRSTDASHEMVDSVRGVTKVLMSDTDANETTDAESLQVFNSDGFTLGTNSGGWNRDSRTYVYYSWKGGTAFSNDASATSVGSIDSAGKVNAVAGFSIIGYTGNGTNGATVAHGLSKKPEMIWVKNRSKSNGESWCVYVSAGGLDATDQLQLNSNAAFSDTADAWNDTEPTTSVFSISGDDRTNDDGETFIAYCFHSVDGYCKVGSYVGNAADDAPFVYTGFRPKWVMYKKVAGSASWFIVDTARNTVNKAFLNLSPDTATDENTSGAGQTELFILSNGFKPGGAGGDANGNNEPYIYLAFAETPFKNSNAR